MEYRDTVFISVVENLSFSKAAGELNLSQPAVTKHIKELEQRYHTNLFERKGNKIYQRKLFSVLITVLGLSLIGQGQTVSKRVLFLGNSYTAVNNLPQMFADVASSTGDTIYFDSNTPGGHTLKQHSTNAASLAKLAKGDWDYVVLQEQSQLPSFPISQVEVEVFPYARALNCTRVMEAILPLPEPMQQPAVSILRFQGKTRHRLPSIQHFQQ